MQTMKDQILARINRLGEGKAFSAKDFLDIATRGTIDVTLGDLTREGIIRRIGRGLYDLPKVNVAYCAEIRMCCRRDKSDRLLLPQILECLWAC
jgi:predicted transcriptional regulator of viral defense system